MGCRILLDEHLMADTATILEAAGHEAVTVQDVGLRSASDREIFSFAASHGRILVSGDIRDFIRLAKEWNATDQSFPGVVLLSMRGATPPSVVARRIEQHIWPDPLRLENSVTWLPPL